MFSTLLLSIALAPSYVSVQDKAPREVTRPAKVQVYILAGQSNMEGFGQVRSLPRLGEHPEHGDLLGRLQTPGGDWIERDDVHVAWLSSKHTVQGPLTVGHGFRDFMVGPELMFGVLVGDATEAPVLLIKTCWGGKDVYCDFRSPSSGEPEGPAAERLAHEAKTSKDGTVREVGAYYRAMLGEIQTVLGDLETYVPGYAGQGHEIAGLAWFQGWNDYHLWRGWPGVIDQYPDHLAALFTDLREDLGVPHLPIAVGELGVHGTSCVERARDGHGPSKAMLQFRAVQRTACKDRGLDNITFVPTADFWDERLAELSAIKDQWKNQKRDEGIENSPDNELPTKELSEEYRSLGGNWDCHYNGSATSYCLVGHGLAEAILALQAAPSAPH